MALWLPVLLGLLYSTASAQESSAGLSRSDGFWERLVDQPRIVLTDTTVVEKAQAGRTVGRFRLMNVEGNPPVIWHLVDDAKGRFMSTDSLLRVRDGMALDYEKQPVQYITVEARWPEGHSVRNKFAIQLIDVNEKPTDILLSSNRVDENSRRGTAIGSFAVVDEDSGDSHSLRLMKNPGNAFRLDRNNLVVNDSASVNFEQDSLMSIRLRAADRSGGYIEKSFTIHVTDQNDPPSGLTLSPAKISENSPPGSVVGSLRTLDEDSGDSHRYQLIDGAEGTFVLNGQKIVVGEGAHLDFETRKKYTVTVRSTDQQGLYVTQPLNISLININEKPHITALNNLSIPEDHPTDSLYIRLSDPETRASYLQLHILSSDTTLFRPSDILDFGTGAERSVVLHPIENAYGTAQITMIVDDGEQQDSTRFFVEVRPVNDKPYLARPPRARVSEGASLTLRRTMLDTRDMDNTPRELKYTIIRKPRHGQLYFSGSLKIGNGFRFSQQQLNDELISYRHDGSETTADSLVLRVADPDGGSIRHLQLPITIRPVNDPPVVSHIESVDIPEDSTSALIQFKVSDAESPGVALHVSGSSTNPSLLPPEAITLGGLDRIRSIRLKPTPNRFGTVLINLMVDDGEDTTRTSFRMNVLPENDPPHIAKGDTLETKEDQPLWPVPLHIFDEETEINALEISVHSEKVELIDPDDIEVRDYGGNKALYIKPHKDRFGEGTITVSVSDGQNTATTNFLVEIDPVNDPPSPFTLYGTDVQLIDDSLNVNFEWEQAYDIELQHVQYLLRIFGEDTDTTITHINQPGYRFAAGHRLKSNTEYSWQVFATDGSDTTASKLTKEFVTPILPDAPRHYVLQQNYPNPFNPTTQISYSLPVTSRVELTIYDMSGRKVEKLVDQVQAAGEYNVMWNASDRASGMYVYRLVAVGLSNHKRFTKTQKMVLVK